MVRAAFGTHAALLVPDTDPAHVATCAAAQPDCPGLLVARCAWALQPALAQEGVWWHRPALAAGTKGPGGAPLGWRRCRTVAPTHALCMVDHAGLRLRVLAAHRHCFARRCGAARSRPTTRRRPRQPERLTSADGRWRGRKRRVRLPRPPEPQRRRRLELSRSLRRVWRRRRSASRWPRGRRRRAAAGRRMESRGSPSLPPWARAPQFLALRRPAPWLFRDPARLILRSQGQPFPIIAPGPRLWSRICCCRRRQSR